MLKILFALKNQSEAIMSVLTGHEVDTLSKNETIPSVIQKDNYDLVLLEGEMDSIPSIKAVDPRIEIIFFGEKEENAIEAIKHGASAFSSFPVDIGGLKETIDNISNFFAIRKESAELERQLSAKYTFFPGIVGKNPKMLDIFALIRRIAPYYKTVTIMGETGTGKELIARALHSLSLVAKNPFIVCNCAGLVETLVESELFGHKKGAFTGAIIDKMGLFEAAGEGTIFLDEIGELPLPIQPRLLRVLQSGEFRRLGGNELFRAKCKVIAATNKELAAEVKTGGFREDLFYRLTPLTIHMPPLREKKDDITFLCRVFLDKFNQETGKNILGISRPAQSVLLTYDWPGNVRELENVLEQAAVMTTESFIRLEDLPPHVKEVHKQESDDLTDLDDVVKEHIEEVLKKCGGNKSRAAKILGISRRALSRKIEKYAIS